MALWPFSELSNQVVPELVSGRGGSIIGAPELVDGPPGLCGRALRFHADASVHVKVDDDPAWDVARGGLDLWVRINAPGGDRALISRDAVRANQPGHFLLMLSRDDRLVMRIQRQSLVEEGEVAVALCTAQPLSQGVWHHIVLDFGEPQARLLVDGVAADFRGRLPVSPGKLSNFVCGVNSEQGIAGNDEPWLFGASAHAGPVGFQATGLDLARVVLRARL